MINQNRSHKILLVGDCLAGGGAEKVHAQLSIYFQKNGIEISNCIFSDWVTYGYSGSLLNLGEINPNGFFMIRRMKRFLAFRKFVKRNHFDHIIDFRMRTNSLLEVLISKFVYGQNAIYTVHSGILGFYFPKSTVLSRFIYNQKKIIAVSKAIKQEIINRKFAGNVDFIHNPADLKSAAQKSVAFEVNQSKYIIAAGRMNDDVKQFDKLIVAYSNSDLPQKNIRLLLLGDGKNQELYKEIARNLGIDKSVIFKNFVENPFPYFRNALFLVLSSKNEGFGNVIVEALSTGTPAVAFDCFAGPNEIILNEHNGLLVENQNFDKLTEAMNRMVNDAKLHEICKQNAIQTVQKFDIEIIGKQWLEYLKINVS